ncbi:rhombosortase [Endozoicomonas gorgoniicola]|uniref:Rhombosortase n=1 Tax=Endozoicomonas gorgoniicola TaxID=1234144 RepID=A0ABT3MUS7_9GAMM|nr:rhombosortase [Endozoicomonas gorgoniicola]MCW7553128.1 rhombosortase [Endozoicomonas gorgoniicola]
MNEIFIELGKYQRLLIEQGEWWRLITAHFTHFNLNHLLSNLAGLMLIGLINRSFLLSKAGASAILFLCGWVSACLWFLDPSLQGYAGFSGVLHGLLILAIALQDEFSSFFKLGVVLLVTSKIVLEQQGVHISHLANIDYGRPVSVASHLYGALGGLALIAAQWGQKYLRQGRNLLGRKA